MRDNKFHVISTNCRGLSDKQKRRDVFKFVRETKASIACLQDIHLDPKLESYVQAEWALEAIFCPYKSNARGVAILFNNNFEFKINRYHKDIEGNFIVMDLSTAEKNITLINVYGPNKDSPQFYRELHETIKGFNNEYIIACGDWNIALDPEMDRINYVNDNNPKAREALKEIVSKMNLTDIWRFMYPDKKDYTWRQQHSFKQGRIDFYLTSENLVQSIKNVSIKTGYKTDHRLITLEISFNENIPGH